jgi:uncharacterized membrane protein
MPNANIKIQLSLHVLAIIALGVMAGFFGTYSANVNLAMLQVDGATYATVQSAFNRNVRHGLFFVFFFSPPLHCLFTALSAWSARKQGWFWCMVIAAIVYALGIIVFTQQVNLPLNAYTESWNPNALPADWASVRDQWNAANLWRSVVSMSAFMLAVIALAWRVIAAHRD